MAAAGDVNLGLDACAEALTDTGMLGSDPPSVRLGPADGSPTRRRLGLAARIRRQLTAPAVLGELPPPSRPRT